MIARLGKEAAAGLLFAAIGVGALWIGWGYPLGTAQKPGTGVLPAILSWALIVMGSIIAGKAVLTGDVPIGNIAWRALLAVTIATVAFGLLVDRVGLVPAMLISLTVCALGTPETRWPEYAVFLAIMILLSWATFVWLLGMPIPVFAWKA